MSKLDCTLILAAYNEGPTLEASVLKIIKVLRETRLKWEIIFVEDKSTDATRKTVEKIVKGNVNYRAIYHRENMGRGKSVADGISAAKAPICGFLDVDCEISPSYIPLFVKELKNGADLVVGRRFYEKGWKSISRVAASKIYAELVKKLLGLPIDDTETCFKFFHT